MTSKDNGRKIKSVKNNIRTTRIAIAIDEGHMPHRNPNLGSGPAFVNSGRIIDQNKDKGYITHASPGKDQAIAALFAEIADSWTGPQAAAVHLHLTPHKVTRAETSSRLGVSRPTINNRLWAAGFGAIMTAIEAIEAQRGE